MVNSYQILAPDRQSAHLLARGDKDRVGHRRADQRGSGFAKSSRSFMILQQMYVNFRSVLDLSTG